MLCSKTVLLTISVETYKFCVSINICGSTGGEVIPVGNTMQNLLHNHLYWSKAQICVLDITELRNMQISLDQYKLYRQFRKYVGICRYLRNSANMLNYMLKGGNDEQNIICQRKDLVEINAFVFKGFIFILPHSARRKDLSYPKGI